MSICLSVLSLLFSLFIYCFFFLFDCGQSHRRHLYACTLWYPIPSHGFREGLEKQVNHYCCCVCCFQLCIRTFCSWQFLAKTTAQLAAMWLNRNVRQNCRLVCAFYSSGIVSHMLPLSLSKIKVHLEFVSCYSLILPLQESDRLQLSVENVSIHIFIW